MSIIQALIIGSLSGGLITTTIVIGLSSRSERLANLESSQTEALNNIVKLNASVAEGNIDIKKSLTAPDLLSVACSMEHLNIHGDLLCREMFCRLQTREGDGASQKECESRANISNSLHILNACSDTVSPEFEKCLTVFDRRK